MSPRGLPLLKEVLKNLKCRKPIMPFYAVARGREVGVFQSWDICQELTANFKGAKYRKFDDRESAWDFVKQFRYKSLKPTSDVDDDIPQAKQIKIEADVAIDKNNEDASNSRFDFAAFNLRLTNLENTYQAKIRSLEERLNALENKKAGSTGAEETGEEEKEGRSGKALKSGNLKISATKRKLLDAAAEIIKPGTSRSYSTSALKRLRPSEEDDLEKINLSQIDNSKPSTSTASFKVDPDGYVIAYTDGACPNNGFSTKAGIGVWFNDSHPLNVSAPVKGRTTNIVAEIEAATAAVQVAAGAGINKLCIMTDSKFTISCMTEWIGNWKKNNWKTYKGEPVAVKSEVLELEKACHELEAVKWVHVRGHQGIHGNEQADQLARNGALLC